MQPFRCLSKKREKKFDTLLLIAVSNAMEFHRL